MWCEFGHVMGRRAAGQSAGATVALQKEGERERGREVEGEGERQQTEGRSRPRQGGSTIPQMLAKKEGAVSYERGTPVQGGGARSLRC